MEILEAKKEDLTKIASIENELFALPWDYKTILNDYQSNKYSYYYLLKDNNKIIGYYTIWIVDDYATINKIGIKKDYQQKGYSKLLMDDLIKLCINKRCSVIDLEVRVSNIKAINLYNLYGFEIVNIRKKYYADNHEDAYLMVKKLKGGDNYERIHISA